MLWVCRDWSIFCGVAWWGTTPAQVAFCSITKLTGGSDREQDGDIKNTSAHPLHTVLNWSIFSHGLNPQGFDFWLGSKASLPLLVDA